MFDYPCDWRAGFVMDTNKKQRAGYLLSFEGLSLGANLLKADLEVFTPAPLDMTGSGDTANFKKDDKIKAVGIIESFSFGGGVGDPICVSAYISAENAQILRAKMQSTLTTTRMTKMGWWIINYDAETKEWFEESYPKAPPTVAGQINAAGGSDIRLSVAAEATKIASNIDVNVFALYFEIVPAANTTFALHFASSKAKQFVGRWGLTVGTQNATAMAKP